MALTAGVGIATRKWAEMGIIPHSRKRPVSSDVLQCRQVVDDVCDIVYIVLHENHLTHTDLKPENILFVHSDYDLVPGPKRPYAKKVRVVHSATASTLSLITRCGVTRLFLVHYYMLYKWLYIAKNTASGTKVGLQRTNVRHVFLRVACSVLC